MFGMSKISPQKLREAALQILFALDLGGDSKEVSQLMQQELSLSKEEIGRVLDRVLQVRETVGGLDKILSTLSENYPLERIAFLDRNILRLALFEFKCEELPPKVVISEAIRLARKFSGPESGSFVNALLDAYVQSASISL